MNLKVINTGSAGNSYLLRSKSGASLIIECGVGIRQIKQALDFDLKGVTGCIVSHSHADHCKGVHDVMKAGINTYALRETHESLSTLSNHRAKSFEQVDGLLLTHRIGSFKVLPFRVKHDVPTVGFLIWHRECGKILFITDSYYCPFVFNGLNQVIVEANYSRAIIQKKYGAKSDKMFLQNRIISSHMSFETCIELLKNNDLSKVNNIVLIHLSDSNSNERTFKKETEKLTGKTVTVAKNGIEIEFNLTPF